MHFSYVGENKDQSRTLESQIKEKKPILKYLITYNVYSNTANSHFILKYTSLDIMQQQQVPLQKVTK